VRPASEAEKARLGETFAALCRIPSPFGHERACADAVRAELEGMGLEVVEDHAADAAGAECGNLLAWLPSRRSERTVLLCAHLDTVEPAAPIEPEVVDGGWQNANEGILGADNKAAVAVMLEVARRASVEGSPVGLELLFTVSEENALAGAKAFDVGELRAEFGYVFDHATAIG
jgi:tripeptide aminopeptidase